jgi:hypothetical protein
MGPRYRWIPENDVLLEKVAMRLRFHSGVNYFDSREALLDGSRRLLFLGEQMHHTYKNIL